MVRSLPSRVKYCVVSAREKENRRNPAEKGHAGSCGVVR